MNTVKNLFNRFTTTTPTKITNDNISGFVRDYIYSRQKLPSDLKNISNWDVSEVTNMANLFDGYRSFNQPLNWDVSKVKNMERMFQYCSSFNQDLSNWNVSEVRNMERMFYSCSSFNQPLNWDVSEVIDMAYMFHGCSSFNQDLSNWNVSENTNMENMFIVNDNDNLENIPLAKRPRNRGTVHEEPNAAIVNEEPDEVIDPVSVKEEPDEVIEPVSVKSTPGKATIKQKPSVNEWVPNRGNEIQIPCNNIQKSDLLNKEYYTELTSDYINRIKSIPTIITRANVIGVNTIMTDSDDILHCGKIIINNDNITFVNLPNTNKEFPIDNIGVDVHFYVNNIDFNKLLKFGGNKSRKSSKQKKSRKSSKQKKSRKSRK